MLKKKIFLILYKKNVISNCYVYIYANYRESFETFGYQNVNFIFNLFIYLFILYLINYIIV